MVAVAWLESGPAQPGIHTFAFDGHAGGAVLPEGGYRFSVTATDGRHRVTRRP